MKQRSSTGEGIRDSEPVSAMQQGIKYHTSAWVQIRCNIGRHWKLAACMVGMCKCIWYLELTVNIHMDICRHARTE
jgi:hypothetical protein